MLLEELRNIKSEDLLTKLTKEEVPPIDQTEYESPDEEDIQEKCKDLQINTIDEVPTHSIEESYDNVDIIPENENVLISKGVIEFIDDLSLIE